MPLEQRSKPIEYLFLFILLWQATFKISNAAVLYLLRFFKFFVLVVGRSFQSPEMVACSAQIPQTLSTVHLHMFSELEALIKKLESRAQKSDSVTSKEGRFRRKERMLSSPSRSDPPPNPPPWSVEGAPSSEETPLSSRGTPGPSRLSQNPQDHTEMSSTDGEEQN